MQTNDNKAVFTAGPSREVFNISPPKPRIERAKQAEIDWRHAMRHDRDCLVQEYANSL